MAGVGGSGTAGGHGGLPSVGDLVADKYRVERVLGRGGMGVVVGAKDVALGRRVALKFLAPQHARDEGVLARFRREARAAARLQSEYAVRLLDVASLPSGAPFLVMEYLEGRDLASLLAVDGPLAPERAAAYALEACAALTEAHARGIVHRDLKPSNLFLCQRVSGPPLIKVLDFGISKVGPGAGAVEFVTGEATLTGPATQLGSPLYMSPEQLRGARDVDARSDIWQLGVCLYELVTGRLPFEGTTLPLVYANILTGTPSPMVGPAGPPPAGFQDVVMRCLERDPARRFPDVQAFAAALAPFATGASPSGLPLGPPPASDPAASLPRLVPAPTPSGPPPGLVHTAGSVTVGGVGRTPADGASGRRRAVGLVLGLALTAGLGATLPRALRRAAVAPSTGSPRSLALAAPQAPASPSEAPRPAEAPPAAEPPPRAPPAPRDGPAPSAAAAPSAPPRHEAPGRREPAGASRLPPRPPHAPGRGPHPPGPAQGAAPPADGAAARDERVAPPAGASPRDRTSAFGDRQ
ncbi:MAG TPA: serine/threonine-protein kinase [Polyangiaceae bacterium]|nr:serine/threonine-protein kinase [Polyangiaceae bacterium]